jgi:hypothetical protein
MAQNRRQGPEPELPPIEIDFSNDETMEIVGITDDSATPVPTAKSGVRPVPSRPATSPVPTAPLEPRERAGDEDDLDADQLQLFEAIRQSVEKSAQALRAVAQLCVEKRIFTRGEFRSLGPRSR